MKRFKNSSKWRLYLAIISLFSLFFSFLCVLRYFKDIYVKNIQFSQFCHLLKAGNATVRGLLIFPKLLTDSDVHRSVEWFIKPSQLYLLLVLRWDFVCTGFSGFESWPGPLTKKPNLNVAAKNLKTNQQWKILSNLKHVFCCKQVKLCGQESLSLVYGEICRG